MKTLMTGLRTLAMVLVALVSSSDLAAQERWQPWSFADDSVASTIFGRTARLRVALPYQYTMEGLESDSFPVLVILGAGDGMAFASTITSLRLLDGPFGGAVPPLIIVGVTSQLDSPYPKTSPAMDSLRANAGGAEKWAAFLRAELMPWVRARFRAAPFTVIAGFSGPGHLALYAFAHAPDTFQGAVAVSPAVWWLNARVNDTQLTQDYSRRIARRESGRLYVGLGAFDPFPIRRANERLAAQLRSTSLHRERFRYEVFANDNHQTARERGFVEGVRWIFEPVSLSRNAVYAAMGGYAHEVDTVALRRAYESTKVRYMTGARALGLSEALPHTYLSSMLRMGPVDRRSDPLPIAPLLCADYARWYPRRARPEQCAR